MFKLPANFVLFLVIILLFYTLFYTYSNDFGIFLSIILLLGISYYLWIVLTEYMESIGSDIINGISEVKSLLSKYNNLSNTLDEYKSIGSNLFK